MITIDKLRETATNKPHYCVAGGIKLKTTDGAVRFYNESFVPRIADTIHTHTYGFHSTVLKGTMRHIIYDVKPVEEETNYNLLQIKCMKGEPQNVIAENVTVTETLRTDMPEGSKYSINADIFHRVEFVTDSVVTIINPFEKGCDPLYAINKEIGYVCPWSFSLSLADCWEIIDQIISD